MAGLPYRIDHHLSLIPSNRLTDAAARLVPALQRLSEASPPAAAAIFRHATRADDLPTIESLAARWREQYKRLVVVGCGGSALSALALAMIKHGRMPENIHVLDTLDADLLPQQVAEWNLEECCFLLVSKSGGTAETLAISEFLLAEMEKRGMRDVPERAAAITMARNNPLRALAEKHSLPVFDHDPNLCGRFSALSCVGLIPAAFTGLDVRALRDGAASALQGGLPLAAEGAALHDAHREARRNIAVLMPYTERLYGLALWWRQAAAESLGKNGKGSTPYIALGTADQHSQLQLFLDGPDDKFFTLILPECGGTALGDLQGAMARAMVETLARHRRPVRVIHVERGDERTFGALMMQLMLEIILTAELLGVNPFDQPAVEESKQLTREYLAESAKEKTRR